MTLQALIDKQDSVEIIRDQIAAILVQEIANQQALAIADSKDPALWTLRIYVERAEAWQQFLNVQPGDDVSPLVNVWFDNETFEQSSSNISERQQAQGTFNLDIYGYGRSADNPAGGHFPGDQEAAAAAHRAARLVRNILMASENTYLQLRGLVWQRWPQSITSFQPEQDGQAVQHIWAMRFALSVRYNEFAPQFEGEPLEFVSIEVESADDGELLLGADYDYTAP